MYIVLLRKKTRQGYTATPFTRLGGRHLLLRFLCSSLDNLVSYILTQVRQRGNLKRGTNRRSSSVHCALFFGGLWSTTRLRALLGVVRNVR